MAKITVKEVHNRLPQLAVTLELTQDEAVVVSRLCGAVGTEGELRTLSTGIWRKLQSNTRIAALTDDLFEKDPTAAISIGHHTIPRDY